MAGHDPDKQERLPDTPSDDGHLVDVILSDPITETARRSSTSSTRESPESRSAAGAAR